jgi:hypothetical protein
MLPQIANCGKNIQLAFEHFSVFILDTKKKMASYRNRCAERLYRKQLTIILNNVKQEGEQILRDK